MLAGCAIAPQSPIANPQSEIPIIDLDPTHVVFHKQSQAVIVPKPRAFVNKVPITISVIWPEATNAVAYNLYYGTGPRDYTHLVECSGTNTAVTNLDGWQEYFFAVTALNETGWETDFSDEVNYTPPMLLDLYFVNPGLVLQASADLITWTNCPALMASGAFRVAAQHIPALYFRTISTP